MAPRADQRQVVRRAGAQAGDRVDQLHLGDVGEQPVGLAQQLVDPAGGDRGVEALLLDGGADDQAAVGARHQVDALGGDDPLAGRGAVAGPQLDHLSLDRAHRRAGVLGQPVRPARPGPVRQHDRLGPQLLAGGGPHAGEALALEDPVDHVGAGPHLGADDASAASSAAVSARGSTVASPGAWTPPLKDGVSPGSSSRQRRGGSHSASRPSERWRSWTRRSSAASSRSRATWRAPWRAYPVATPRRRLQLGDELRVQLRGGQRHLQQLAARRRSARRPGPASRRRRGWRRPAARPARARHARPALGSAPGAGEADHPAANEYRVETALLGQAIASAGITRIRSRRSVTSVPPSQPSRAPVTPTRLPTSGRLQAGPRRDRFIIEA